MRQNNDFYKSQKLEKFPYALSPKMFSTSGWNNLKWESFLEISATVSL